MRKTELAQYNVQFPNEPSVHAKLSRFLVKEKISLKFLMTVRLGDKTTIQFLAPRSQALKEKLQKIGVSVRIDQVFQLKMPHHAWELHKLAKSLAQEEINIVSLYTSLEGENMRVVMAVDQTANALELIRKLGFDPDYAVYR